jgi:hypothetical protein
LRIHGSLTQKIELFISKPIHTSSSSAVTKDCTLEKRDAIDNCGHEEEKDIRLINVDYRFQERNEVSERLFTRRQWIPTNLFGPKRLMALRKSASLKNTVF